MFATMIEKAPALGLNGDMKLEGNSVNGGDMKLEGAYDDDDGDNTELNNGIIAL